MKVESTPISEINRWDGQNSGDGPMTYWVDFENPPRHSGDPLVALTRLLQQVGTKPYRLRLVEHLALREKTDGSGEMERFTCARFEAWPPEAWPV